VSAMNASTGRRSSSLRHVIDANSPATSSREATDVAE
jgi:hypothetical protein